MTDDDLYRRAAARCAVIEPHRDVDEDCPCSGCLLAAARQLAIPAHHVSAPASSPASSSPRPAPGFDGAAGREGPPPSLAGGSTSANSNRPVREHRAAEGATVLARTEGNRWL